MKTTKFKTTVALGLAAIFLLAPDTNGQGFFGWKKKPKPVEEGTTNLFPGASAPGYTSSSEPSAPRDLSIFKSGQPENVQETSYIIKDGERVPAPKRRSFFKRYTKAGTTTKTVPDAPKPNYAAVEPSFTPGSPAPPPVIASSDGNDRRKVFPRLRKKDEVISPYESSGVAPAPPSTGETPPLTFDPASAEEKESRFNPLAKFRRKKEAGPTEVLVNDGGTLVSSGANATDDIKVTDRVPVTSPGSGSSSAKPPQQVEGSVVYDSWDDVAARKTSAADQIVSQMKAQEAAHKRKVAAARKAYEEKVRKAEEDARIRAIMQGGVPAR